MADFEIREIEGMRQICVGIRDEVARARRGALSAMLGGDRARPAPAGGAGDLLRAAFTDEARIGPSYRGSGVIYLQPSMDGYHVIEVAQGQRWILEPGACWASSGAAARPRAPMLPSLRAGDGLLSCRSTLSGAGGDRRAGPAEVDGSATRCRAGWFSGCAAGLASRAAPQPDLWAAAPAGLYRQQRLRVYTGSGALLVCPAPNWNEKLYSRVSVRSAG